MATPSKCVNKFQNTKSAQRKFKQYIAELPPSKYYRKDLEPLLGAAVKLKCNTFKLIPYVVDNVPCLNLLLRNAVVSSVPRSRGIPNGLIIEHIWTVLDAGWKDRNPICGTGTLTLKGFIYLYSHKRHKNIGFQAFYASFNPEVNQENKDVSNG